MEIQFPYEDMDRLFVPDKSLLGVFKMPEISLSMSLDNMIKKALTKPISSPPLKEVLSNKSRVLIISDDNTRNTPVKDIMPPLLKELKEAQVKDKNIKILMALGTHRPMTNEELIVKLGKDVVSRFNVINHNPKDNLFFYGATSLGVDIWINKEIKWADYIIGLGRIMPIMVAGFTGGGKIIVPGICGDKTNDQMHWQSLDIPEEELLGKRDNPVRNVIDEVATKVGLKFIINVIMNSSGEVINIVAGDPIKAHIQGAALARKAHIVKIPYNKADVVIADGYPFDIEFWQVNKALDAAGMVVKEKGIIILISPCYEGISRSHPEILRYGYRNVKEIKQMVEQGLISPTVGVHMIQVSRVVIERARCILVSDGISPEDKKRLGLLHADTPQTALKKAFDLLGPEAKVSVLHRAAEMLPVVGMS